jgi:chromosome segregation ATPase
MTQLMTAAAKLEVYQTKLDNLKDTNDALQSRCNELTQERDHFQERVMHLETQRAKTSSQSQDYDNNLQHLLEQERRMFVSYRATRRMLEKPSNRRTIIKFYADRSKMRGNYWLFELRNGKRKGP